MSDVKKSTKLVVDVEELHDIAGFSFKPSSAQREAKARFWTIANEQALFRDPLSYKPMEIAELLQLPVLTKWFQQKHFANYFFNRFEGEQKLELLWDKALDAMSEILDNGDAKVQGARVSVIKLLAEIRAAKRQPKMVDKGIQDMDLDQLNAFIEREVPKLQVAKPSEEDEDDE